MSTTIEAIQNLQKALEAGGYNVMPSNLTQGAALQHEDLSTIMELTTFEDKHLKLAKMLGKKTVKSMLPQFNRQLSYGQFGGSAQLEGNVGQEETSDYVRITVPMCFYSHTRRVTLAATLVDTFDGTPADERAAQDAAKKIAADIEFDSFRGRADFSNAGVFDGNPNALPGLMANMFGVDVQVRQSDSQRNAHDLMFGEYGSDDSVVIYCGGVLTQDNIEDSTVRSAMNLGNAEKLMLDPKSLSAYNKITFGKERIVLAGTPQSLTGADLKRQATSNGEASLEASRFLSGKTRPQAPRSNAGAPVAPGTITPTSTTGTTATAFNAGEVYTYFATTGNEVGESGASPVATATIANTGDYVSLSIVNPSSGVARFLNIYRSPAGGTAASAKFIGRVVLGAGPTTFVDLGNKQPGFVTGYLLQGDTMEMKELAGFSKTKLAETDLSTPVAYYQFTTLAVMQPRKNVLLDNIKG